MAKRLAPARGDLVWVSLGSMPGHEQTGRRPAVVVSPRAYNAKAGLALICPITSARKGYPFEVPLPEGSRITGVILADMVRITDWRARGVSHAGSVPHDLVLEVLARLATLLDPRVLE